MHGNLLFVAVKRIVGPVGHDVMCALCVMREVFSRQDKASELSNMWGNAEACI